MIPFLLLITSLITLLFMFVVALRRKISHPGSMPAGQELMELISRYRFFQGNNLKTFSQLINANNFAGIERLIREKFEAQKKPNAESLAQEVIKKLSNEFGG